MDKKCYTCNVIKSIDDFYNRHRNCKSCFNSDRRILVICRKCKLSYPPGKKGRGRYCSDKCRFMDKVDQIYNGCWIWNGHKQKNRGYGTFILSGWKRSGLAHRASYIIFNGPLEDDKCVIHVCDNPSCVNPLHLKLGTIADNVADMIKKGRSRFRNNVILNKYKVLEIRKLRSDNVKIVDIAKKFGVSSECVSAIVNRRTWKHV